MQHASWAVSILKKALGDFNIDEPPYSAFLEKLRFSDVEYLMYQKARASLVVDAVTKMRLFAPPFMLQRLNAEVQISANDNESYISARMKFQVGERILPPAVSDGDGTVRAIDLAARKILEDVFPCFNEIVLTHYRVHGINDSVGTSTRVCTQVTIADGSQSWTTAAISTDVVAASWRALEHGFLFKLMLKEGIVKSAFFEQHE